jgi:HTH-type transcriptional regulator/antitoxin HipB
VLPRLLQTASRNYRGKHVKDYPIQTEQQLSLLLRSLRKARAMTQGELAERLGVAQQTISQMERDAAAVTVQRLTKALSVLGAQLVLRDLKGNPSKAAAGDAW